MKPAAHCGAIADAGCVTNYQTHYTFARRAYFQDIPRLVRLAKWVNGYLL